MILLKIDALYGQKQVMEENIMPAPFIWLAWVGAAAFAKWYGLETLFHGGDHKAAWESVSKKITAGAKKAAAGATDGAKFMKDFAIVSTAVVQLRNSSNLDTLTKGCHALKRALDTLPEETVSGLNNVFSIDQVIDEALKTSLSQCGLALLEQDAGDLSPAEVLQRSYFATYLVGRSGVNMNSQEKVTSRGMLSRQHMKLGTDTDMEILDTLVNYTPADAMKLVKQLTAYKGLMLEDSIGGLYPVYIAKALGGDITPKNDTLLIDEIITMFPKT